MIDHDFKRFPELSNSQMDTLYFQSPHKQIFEDFDAEVVKVVDGDTIRVRCAFRDFDFPIRFMDTNAKEMSEGGGEAKEYLERIIDGEQVSIGINPKNRVGKFGRLLGQVNHRGINVNQMMIMMGMSTSFEAKNEGKIPNINKEVNLKKWFS